ncbi:hypothetical protein E2C01_025969 [Portunus trituberculatus]|uniref:Uncharacterized protein n=1 Tax=Portunus trituberculatus TaxID=210409 RepID=A0A5B7EHL3_PORTR|nr:hypothetical protein [Portunus trituberculatus]
MPRSDRELAGVVGSFVSRDNARVWSGKAWEGPGSRMAAVWCGVVCSRQNRMSERKDKVCGGGAEEGPDSVYSPSGRLDTGTPHAARGSVTPQEASLRLAYPEFRLPGRGPPYRAFLRSAARHARLVLAALAATLLGSAARRTGQTLRQGQRCCTSPLWQDNTRPLSHLLRLQRTAIRGVTLNGYHPLGRVARCLSAAQDVCVTGTCRATDAPLSACENHRGATQVPAAMALMTTIRHFK